LTWPWRIVIAEDNPADIQTVRKSLRKHEIDCELFVMTDGKQVFDFIKKTDSDHKLPTPDLALLDMDLPIHNGYELLKQIRGSERCGLIPVIIMTGSSCADDKAAAKRFAAGHYFEKPTDFDAFMKIGEVIKKTLQEKSESNGLTGSVVSK
jgi:chemotaxis family two-component system response regulator Rcp1